MATQYFRITAYDPDENLSAIFDSYGLFDKLWQFSSYLLQRGFKILEVSNDEKFLDVNIQKSTREPDKLILRAHCKGKPDIIEHSINGISYQAVKVGEKIYIPDKDKTGGVK